MSSEITTQQLCDIIGVSRNDIGNWTKRALVPDFQTGLPLALPGKGRPRKFDFRAAYFLALVSDLRQVMPLGEAAATARFVIEYDMDDFNLVCAAGGKLFFDFEQAHAVVAFSPRRVMQRMRAGWPQ